MHPKPVPQTFKQQDDHPSHHQHKVVASKRWHAARTVINSIALLLAVIVLALAAGLVATYHEASNSFLVLICAGTASGFALIWQVAEFFTLCTFKDRGIHPGAHVALHLLISLTYGAGTTISVILYANEVTCTSSQCYRVKGVPTTPGDRSPYFALFRAILAMMGLALATHLVLFVRYCIECNRRNKSPSSTSFFSVQFSSADTKSPEV